MAFLCTSYLIVMVIYLVLRLLLGGGIWPLGLLNAFAVYTFAPLLVLLPLAILLSLWREFARLGLLGLLAVVWFGPFFQPNSMPAPGDGTIVEIATLNLNGEQNDDLDAAARWLLDTTPHIVLIQEYPAQFDPQREALSTILPEFTLLADNRAILAAYPIIPGENDTLIVEINGQPLTLLNVQAPLPVDDPTVTNVSAIDYITTYDETARDRYLDALLEQIETLDTPYIVGGDFNLSQHSIRYGDLALQMRDSYRATGSGLGATWPVHPLPLIRVDYLWYSTGLQALSSTIGPDVGSDHLPLLVSFELLPDEGVE